VASEAMTHNAIAFEIQAQLWAQPLPLELFLRTEIDLETGSVQMAEPGRDGGRG
jgi:type VI secretion system protein ImpF